MDTTNSEMQMQRYKKTYLFITVILRLLSTVHHELSVNMLE